MNSNIQLRTNDSSAELELRAIERCDEDFTARLFIRSRGFQAEHRFDFGVEPLVSFHGDIVRMNSTLEGCATLSPRWEEGELIFQLNHLGHLIVRGSLCEQAQGPFQQKLQFAFVTDQTCLAPFERDLRMLLEGVYAA
jgi:hypothetical protein